jgi:cyclic beta-1,2-glucan synthetase
VASRPVSRGSTISPSLISHQDGRVDRDNATAFLAAYQTARTADLGELWAFPIMLRLGCSRMSDTWGCASRAVEKSGHWPSPGPTACSRRGGGPEADLIHVLAEFADADVPLTAPFVEDFYARLQAQGPALAHCPDLAGASALGAGSKRGATAGGRQPDGGADQISIANSVGSLRFISAMDWGKFVEELSLVEHLLRLDPAESTRRKISPRVTATGTPSRP